MQTGYIDKKVEEWSTHFHLKKKHAGSGEWRILCPFHEDTDQSLFINRETGKWYCFGCAHGSKHFMNLVKKMAEKFGETIDYAAARAGGIFIPEEVKKPSVKVVTTAFETRGRDYFIGRGFTLQDLRKIEGNFFLKQMKVNGRWFLRFDVFDFNHSFVGWVRRSLDGDKLYLNKTGFDSQRYFYGEWVLPKTIKKVAIVEGVFDVYKVWLASFPVLGMINYKKASLKVARLLEWCHPEELVFVFDSDVSADSSKAKDWMDACNLFKVRGSIVSLGKQWDDPGAMPIYEIETLLGSI